MDCNMEDCFLILSISTTLNLISQYFIYILFVSICDVSTAIHKMMLQIFIAEIFGFGLYIMIACSVTDLGKVPSY
jgi:hypothetical protein